MKTFRDILAWTIMSNLLFWGGAYGGYKTSNRDWLKKLNEYVQKHPEMTMSEFCDECNKEDND